MDWVYLSPHLDDVAFSCGGLVWERVRRGQKVVICTICAGDPPPGPLSGLAQSLHERWKLGREAVAQRRSEDMRACQRMGAAWQHFPIPDCIYRKSPQSGQALYNSEEALFGEIHPEEQGLVDRVGQMLKARLPTGAEVVCPLGLGGHVDHRLTRAAAERTGRALWYYADYPYVQLEDAWTEDKTEEMSRKILHLSEAGLEAWVEAAGAYASQVSSFWADMEAMQGSIRGYAVQIGGVELWRRRNIT
jgi:LmbE family N-acetylglucosaminyl deacetylase